MTAVFSSAAIIGFFLQIGFWGNKLISRFFTHPRGRGDSNNEGTLQTIAVFVRMVLWLIVLLMILNNFGVNITGLLAGLGIGGIAVALAAQNILSDLFCSIAIILDKPFVVGDFIEFDGYLGTIEKIGIKTTHIRSLWGEQIIVRNSQLIEGRLKNYKRMAERRVVFKFGVVYQTPAEKLEKIGGMVREIIESIKGARFDRAHFVKFGDSSLDFECVYYVLSNDYSSYMDIHQAINLELVRRFKNDAIEFAYPTKTLYVQHGQSREAGSHQNAF